MKALEVGPNVYSDVGTRTTVIFCMYFVTFLICFVFCRMFFLLLATTSRKHEELNRV